MLHIAHPILRRQPVALALILIFSSSWLQAVTPEDSLKAATVQVKSTDGGTSRSSAAGTMIYVSNGYGYILTTDSAVASTSVVFRLDEGTVEYIPGDPFEKTFVKLGGKVISAELVARDRVNNLAVVRVPEDGTAATLSPFKKAPEVPRETESVLICGPRANESLEIKKSTVSSLRKKDGKLQFIQLDVALGNQWSGSPVTNTRGQMIGMVVGGLGNRGISFVVPNERLLDFLRGGTGPFFVDVVDVSKTEVRVDARLELADPFLSITDLSFVLSGNGEPKRADFELEGRFATASITVSGTPGTAADLTYHAEYTLLKKSEESDPMPLSVSFGGVRKSDLSAARWLKMSDVATRINEPPPPRPFATGREFVKSRRGFATISSKGVSITTKNGFLVRIEGTREVQRLPLGFAVKWLSFTHAGVAIYSQEIDQLWIIDPSDLGVKSRFGLTFDSLKEIKWDPSGKVILATTESDQEVRFDPSSGRYEFVDPFSK